MGGPEAHAQEDDVKGEEYDIDGEDLLGAVADCVDGESHGEVSLGDPKIYQVTIHFENQILRLYVSQQLDFPRNLCLNSRDEIGFRAEDETTS